MQFNRFFFALNQNGGKQIVCSTRIQVQSNLTLRTANIRTNLALRTRSQMTNLANLALRTVKIRKTWHWVPKWQWPKMFLKSILTVRYFGQKTIKLVIVNCMQFSQFWAASVVAQARVSTTNLLLASTLSFSSALSLHKQSEKYQVLITYSTLIFDCVAISFF